MIKPLSDTKIRLVSGRHASGVEVLVGDTEHATHRDGCDGGIITKQQTN